MFQSQIICLGLYPQNGPKWIEKGRRIFKIGHGNSPPNILPLGPLLQQNICQNIAQPPEQLPLAAASNFYIELDKWAKSQDLVWLIEVRHLGSRSEELRA